MNETGRKICGGSLMAEQSLFQATGGGSIPTSPLQLELREIDHKKASECYKKWHYLGETDFMSTWNLGVMFNKRLYGCISLGVPNAREIKGVYDEITQKNWWEIKRFALSDDLPKNSESRVIAIALKLLKKFKKPDGVITYADTNVGHSGVIYRASGFNYFGLTAQKTDLFINGNKVGKKGQYRRAKESEIEEWKPRSRKHLFIKLFKRKSVAK